MDRSIFATCGFKVKGSSDPFCKLVVDRMIIYSNVVEKTTNPIWEFYAEFPITDPSEQELVMELYSGMTVARPTLEEAPTSFV